MAKKTLVVVESPAKAKTINKYLGRNYVVEASVGHIKDLVKSRLGVDVDNGYEPKYVTIKGKAEIIKKIRGLAAKAQTVLIATDPDREGEAIAWHLASEIRKKNTNIQRVLFNEITSSGVKKGLEAPREIDEALFLSQQARRVLDRLIGFKVSPFLWRALIGKSSTPLSAGRVQSVALRLICEREQEIGKFKPIEYWSIQGDFAPNGAGDERKTFSARLASFDGRDIKNPEGSADDPANADLDTMHFIRNEREAERLIASVRTMSFSISDVQVREVKRKPPQPFITSTLQQEASRRLGLNARKTMQIAQKLYEGVSMGDDGEVGLITYMRTDSFRISAEAQQAARERIEESFGAEYLPDTPPVYKSKNPNVQDAHEAIRPTALQYSPKDVRKATDVKTAKLYELIYNRFLASQMNPSISDQTSVIIAGDQCSFRASGSVLKFKGFLAAYAEVEDDDAKDDNAPKTLPPGLVSGLDLDLRDTQAKQSYTKAPPRFSEATLVKELEARGIGRPSTYAAIVGTIQERRYVEQQSRRFHATPLGLDVNEVLMKYFPDVFKTEFTAAMETELDTIAVGEHSYKEVVSDFFIPLQMSLTVAEEKGDIPDILCDNCNAPMEMKIGRFGAFFGCTRYPECDGIKTMKQLSGEDDAKEEPQLAEGVVCDECGGAMYTRSGRYGKFYGCANYPTCKGIKPIPLGIKCPKCKDGDIIERRGGKSNRTFYGCSRYPECDFIANYKPVNQACEACGHHYLEIRWKKDEGESLYCPHCKNATLIVEPSETESAA